MKVKLQHEFDHEPTFIVTDDADEQLVVTIHAEAFNNDGEKATALGRRIVDAINVAPGMYCPFCGTALREDDETTDQVCDHCDTRWEVSDERGGPLTTLAEVDPDEYRDTEDGEDEDGDEGGEDDETETE